MRFLDEMNDEVQQADYQMDMYSGMLNMNNEFLNAMHMHLDCDSGDSFLQVSHARFLNSFKQNAVFPFKR